MIEQECVCTLIVSFTLLLVCKLKSFLGWLVLTSFLYLISNTMGGYLALWADEVFFWTHVTVLWMCLCIGICHVFDWNRWWSVRWIRYKSLGVHLSCHKADLVVGKPWKPYLHVTQQPIEYYLCVHLLHTCCIGESSTRFLYYTTRPLTSEQRSMVSIDTMLNIAKRYLPNQLWNHIVYNNGSARSK